MKPVKLKENIYWVGGIDWDLRDFHGYLTQRGSTYNAYLIIDEKITLVDNVKHYLYDEMIKRISHIIDPAKIDYIIQNHVEMDHSGGMPRLLDLIPKAKVFTNAMGIKGLNMHYKNNNWDFQEVKTGDTINIGKRNLTFLTTPMVHWPDNMVTYCPEEKILFSNDAFGQHIASSERLEVDYPFNIVMEEARKYYANIVLPYSKQVQNVLKAAAPQDIEMIAPSHGLVWTKHIPEIIKAYTGWANNVADSNKALIIYDTMWKSTQKLAYAIGDAFENQGIHIKMLNLQETHISDIMTQVITSKYICVGSPTLNSSILPTVAAFLYYLKGLSPKDRIGLAFSSYGWGGQSVDILQNLLGDPKECGFTMMPPIKVQYIPDEATLQNITNQVEQNILTFKEEK